MTVTTDQRPVDGHRSTGHATRRTHPRCDVLERLFAESFAIEERDQARRNATFETLQRMIAQSLIDSDQRDIGVEVRDGEIVLSARYATTFENLAYQLIEAFGSRA